VIDKVSHRLTIPPQSEVRSIIPTMKNKLVSFPSLHTETPELSLNEELPEKLPIWMLNCSSKMNWKRAEIWK
jgi:hypothetical protein